MTYSFSIYPEQEEIMRLFSSVGWESANYPTPLTKAISSSEAILTAWDETGLIGLMTAISDGSMNVFFPYLLIHPAAQGKGIGKDMVAQMLERYRHIYRKVLVCSEEKTAFYEKCGFCSDPTQRPMLRIDEAFGAQ